ncbi:MAG TPA: hypothetical protein DD435_15080 [Cyanobacteria bacterium UBA8530]|nr:hypothetical protein [Cyanobacteria bacterium UBA8530]
MAPIGVTPSNPLRRAFTTGMTGTLELSQLVIFELVLLFLSLRKGKTCGFLPKFTEKRRVSKMPLTFL